MELGGHPRKQEEEGTKAEDRKDVRGEDEERFLGNGEDCRDTIDGKNNVRELQKEESQQQWSPEPTHTFPNEEALIMKDWGNRQKPLQQSNQHILRGIGMGFWTEGNFQSCEC